jgi:hypothetical protein
MKHLPRNGAWFLLLAAASGAWLYDQGREDGRRAERQSLANPPGVEAEREEEVESGCPTGCFQPSPGCEIKGNISYKTGERIYHLPGQRWYDDTSPTLPPSAFPAVRRRRGVSG